MQWQADFGTLVDQFLALVPGASGPVVDAGCGSGRDVSAFTARGFRTLGVDLSQQMLARARDRVAVRGAMWMNADIRHMPIPSGWASGVWTNAALLHLDDGGKLEAIREFHRILVPGGPLFVSTLAGSGRSLRPTRTGHRRWFWSTEEVRLTASLHKAGFAIVSARVDPGLVRGTWVNVLALRQ